MTKHKDYQIEPKVYSGEQGDAIFAKVQRPVIALIDAEQSATS